jgi:hypothetical protein
VRVQKACFEPFDPQRSHTAASHSLRLNSANQNHQPAHAWHGVCLAVAPANLKFSYKFTNTGEHTPLAPTQNAKDVPPALFETPLYQVSAVGFDASRTHAIAYVGALCGPDCSSGSYHLLVKEKEGWKETTGSPVCQLISFNLNCLFSRSPS